MSCEVCNDVEQINSDSPGLMFKPIRSGLTS